ncbi:hypothetical protein SADUNF_Sadunf05G0124400 [Salix dunnii]|uniref:Uncharacterized protein n=1 Tax=Salix dunnii TaxID=1413687 RepID=A0A835KB02_9ROSI|nr:hypothetical protein SADUNF_Sadunf05G0124400 [Salix dunnii]
MISESKSSILDKERNQGSKIPQIASEMIFHIGTAYKVHYCYPLLNQNNINSNKDITFQAFPVVKRGRGRDWLIDKREWMVFLEEEISRQKTTRDRRG